MKLYHKFIVSFLLGGLLICGELTLGTGCAFIKAHPQNVDDTAVILKGAVEAAAKIAIEKDKNAKSYFVLAESLLSQFVTGKDLSPDSLRSALNQIPVKELKSVEVNLALTTVSSLYELYYGKQVRGIVSDKLDVAKVFIVAIQDGLKNATQ